MQGTTMDNPPPSYTAMPHLGGTMKEILKNIATCPICKEVQNNAKKLRCQHSFCQHCIDDYIKTFYGNGSFACPVCTCRILPVDSRSDIDSEVSRRLPSDKFIQTICYFLNSLNNANSHETESEQCGVHPEEVATKFCLDCCLPTCEKCLQAGHNNCSQQDLTNDMVNKTDVNRKADFNIEITDTFLKEYASELGNIPSKVQMLCTLSTEKSSKIKEYYANLKRDINEFLEAQEQTTLHKYQTHMQREIEHVLRHEKMHKSVQESLCQRRSFIDLLTKDHSEMLASSAKLAILRNFPPIVKYSAENVLRPLRIDLQTECEMRCMINTELEDMMQQFKLVEIELVSSCHSASFPASFRIARNNSNRSRRSIEGMSSGRGSQSLDHQVGDGRNSPNIPSSPRRRGRHASPSDIHSIHAADRRYSPRRGRRQPSPRGTPRFTSPSLQRDALKADVTGDKRAYRNLAIPNESGRSRSISPSYRRLPTYKEAVGRNKRQFLRPIPSVEINNSRLKPSAPTMDCIQQQDTPQVHIVPSKQTQVIVPSREVSFQGATLSTNPNRFSSPHQQVYVRPREAFGGLVFNPGNACNSPQTFASSIQQGREIDSISYLVTFDTSTHWDAKLPNIVGMTCLKDKYVIADRHNSSLKFVNKHGVHKVNNHLSLLPHCPWDIACIGDTKCIVTSPETLRLLFVGFKRKSSSIIKVLDQWEVTEFYLSVAHVRNGDCIVCGFCPPHGQAGVHILSSESGHVIQSFVRDFDDLYIFKCPSHLTITDNDDIFICDPEAKVVKFMDNSSLTFRTCDYINDGQLLRQFPSPDPKMLTSVPRFGKVIVLDGPMNNIFILSNEGKCVKCLQGVIKHTAPVKLVSVDGKVLVAHADGQISLYAIH